MARATLGWTAAAALLAAAGLAAARVVLPVQVMLEYVSHDHAQVQIIKTNSSASQVVVTLTRSTDSTDFQQMEAKLDPDIQPETKKLNFPRLSQGQTYRICSSLRENGEIVRDSECFTVQTFKNPSQTKGIVAGLVTVIIVLLSACLLYAAYQLIHKRRTSKSMVVSNHKDRENGVDNAAVDAS